MKTIVPEGAKGIDIRDYGAIPNDGIDDTAAIQKALDDERRDANGDPLHRDFYGRPKHLYFPAGTYDVSDTIDWVGNAVTLNGDGSGETILKLQNNAAGFGNSEAPKAIIETSDGNTAFRNNIWNLSVDTGKGNAGAIGIDYGASNNGSMENVTISSGDGQGFIGLSMADGIPGPLLIKDVKVDGFDTGIKNSGPYSATFKNIELTNQNQAGMDAGGGTLVIHGLKSINSVPAIKSDNWFDMVTIVDADLQGGASNRSAIESQGQLYARDIKTSGYQSAIEYGDEAIPGNTVAEYASQNLQLFDDSAQKSLNLPIKDFPEFNDSNLENWGRFEPRWYGDTVLPGIASSPYSMAD
ncbi:MAG: glycoside hydrolase family 55 protein [Cyanobacteria bacterium J06636_16]